MNDSIGAASTTNTQFHPRLAVDQGSGKVAVIWYDCRKDIATPNQKAHLYAAVSQDRFATAARNFQLTASESIWTTTGTYKEYIGLTYVNGFFYPAWLHNLVGTSNFEIYTAKVPF